MFPSLGLSHLPTVGDLDASSKALAVALPFRPGGLAEASPFF